MRHLAILLFLILSSTSTVFAEGDTRAESVTDFLIDRAKDNAIYMFEVRLRRNSELACYLPKTYSYIEDGNLRLLVKNHDLWQSSMENDMRTMVNGYVGHELIETLDTASLINLYIETIQLLDIEYQGEKYSLADISLSLRHDTHYLALINGFYNGINDSRTILTRTKEAIEETQKARQECNIPALTTAEITQLTDAINKTAPLLKQWRDHVKQNSSKISVNKARLTERCKQAPDFYPCKFSNKPPSEWLETTLEKTVAASVAAVATTIILKKFTDEIKQQNTYTGKVLVAKRFIKKLGLDKSLKNPERITNDLLFFAEIADANGDEKKITEILASYTLPPVTFAKKREHQAHVMITAYMAAAAGTVMNSDDLNEGNSNKKGIYVPVGLELSRGYNFGSLSLMLAPFDFGYPISLKLNGVDKDVSFDEIIAPSIAFSYGMNDYPVSVGVAYQQGRKAELTNEVEKRAMIFLGIDMPLLPLY